MQNRWFRATRAVAVPALVFASTAIVPGVGSGAVHGQKVSIAGASWSGAIVLHDAAPVGN